MNEQTDNDLNTESIEQSLENVQEEVSTTEIYENFAADDKANNEHGSSNIKLGDVKLTIAVEAGTATMPITEIEKLGIGDLVVLDTDEGATFPIRVQNSLIGHGKIVKHERKYAVKIVDMVSVPK